MRITCEGSTIVKSHELWLKSWLCGKCTVPCVLTVVYVINRMKLTYMQHKSFMYFCVVSILLLYCYVRSQHLFTSTSKDFVGGVPPF